LSRDGAFFLLPEWTVRWKEVFHKELDLKGDAAKDFMREMHKYLLYVDTGLVEVPVDILNDISDELGLPWKSFKIDLTHLTKSLLNTIGEDDV